MVYPRSFFDKSFVLNRIIPYFGLNYDMFQQSNEYFNLRTFKYEGLAWGMGAFPRPEGTFSRSERTFSRPERAFPLFWARKNSKEGGGVA